MKNLHNSIVSRLLVLALGLSISVAHAATQRPPQKDWNFTVCMANNNNLHRYGVQNFKQMIQSGSTSYINVILQMDEYGKETSNRYFIAKNNPMIIENLGSGAASFSGTRQNFVNLAACAMQNYPAKNQLMLLWNHGAGIKDPDIWGRVLGKWRDEFFVYNTQTGLLELNREFKKDKNWLSLVDRINKERGIAFNDAAEAYLNNQDLKAGLDQIVSSFLGGKKIEILAMDACHMAMVEIASQVKSAVSIMVASEEVEPGTGYNYQPVLNKFASASLTPRAFAAHIVECYRQEYRGVLGDYTQSAVDLSYMDALESDLNKLSLQLIQLIDQGGRQGVLSIREIRFSPLLTTEFLDTDYIDLGHFLKTITDRAVLYSRDPKVGKIWTTLGDIAYSASATLSAMTIANCAGPKLPKASGLSIYFPPRTIDTSYYKTEFAKVTKWASFLEKFVSKREKSETSDSKHALMKEIDEEDHAGACCEECANHKPCAGKKETVETKKPCCDECADHKPCADTKPAEVVKEPVKEVVVEQKPHNVARPRPSGCIPCQKRRK